MKIVKYLFYLSAVIFPLGVLASFKLVGLADVRIVFLDVLTALIVLACYNRITKDQVLSGGWGWFAAAAALSLLVNIKEYELWQVGIGSLYLLRFITYLVLLSILREFKLKTIKILEWGGISVALLGLFQFLFYPNLRNLVYLSWDPHLGRLFSTFLDPQFVGIILVLTLLLLLAKLKEFNWLRLLYIGMVGIALILTFSRSSYLAFVVGMMILFLNKSKRLHYLVSVTALGFIAVIYLVFINSSEGVGQNLFRSETVVSRIESWNQAVAVWQQRPFLGTGFNTYRYAGIIKGKAFNNAGAGVDNSFLFVLATTGVLGLAAYMYFWKRLLYNASPEVFSIASALFIHATFNNTLFYPWVLWWIVVYFASLRESS